MTGLLVLAAIALAPDASAAPASSRRHDPASESQFMGSINSERASRGLGGLVLHTPIRGTSCAWNHQMRDTQTLAHDPGLVGDADQAAPSWVHVGENVGVGYNVAELHAAFMASPSHRQNILDGTYTHVGICVDSSSDGRFWTTHRFLQLASAPPPPTTAAPPPPPPPPAPTTTAAPTTTTSITTASSTTATSSTTVSTAPTTTEAVPAETGDAEVALAVSTGRDPANPAVVVGFVLVSLALAGATFVVGRRRRP